MEGILARLFLLGSLNEVLLQNAGRTDSWGIDTGRLLSILSHHLIAPPSPIAGEIHFF